MFPSELLPPTATEAELFPPTATEADSSITPSVLRRSPREACENSILPGPSDSVFGISSVTESLRGPGPVDSLLLLPLLKIWASRVETGSLRGAYRCKDVENLKEPVGSDRNGEEAVGSDRNGEEAVGSHRNGEDAVGSDRNGEEAVGSSKASGRSELIL